MDETGDGRSPIVLSHTSSITFHSTYSWGHRILMWGSIVGSLIFATLIALELARELPDSAAFFQPGESLASH